MARKQKKEKVKERDLQGFKYFKSLSKLLARLHGTACDRDKAHNRILHMDQYMTLLLLCMFSPICSSLRSMQQASELKKVQRKLGVPRASLGSLSEAARVFDSELLKEIIAELVEQIKPIPHSSSLNDLNQIITLVDGTLLDALPKTVDALWINESNKAFKAHVHYELLKAVPIKSTLTDARTSERDILAKQLEKGRIYVLDRGYAKYKLMQDIIDAQSSFVCRISLNYKSTVEQNNEITPQAQQAGVIRDQTAWLGSDKVKGNLKQPIRLVEVKYVESTYKSMRMQRDTGQKDQTMLIATNRVDLPAEVIALIYQYRWQIEIFFRWFKHILGCRHLLSYCDNGIELEVYAGILACLLIASYTGRKVTKRTFEMFCWLLSGWADEEELANHINNLPKSE